MSVTDAKEAPQKLIELIQRPDVTAAGVAGEYTPEQVELLLSGLNPEDFRVHDKWLEIMQAAHHASSGDAREEFIGWSISDPTYSDHEVVVGRRWDSLHADSAGRRITVKTLFKALHAASRSDLIDKYTGPIPATILLTTLMTCQITSHNRTQKKASSTA